MDVGVGLAEGVSLGRFCCRQGWPHQREHYHSLPGRGGASHPKWVAVTSTWWDLTAEKCDDFTDSWGHVVSCNAAITRTLCSQDVGRLYRTHVVSAGLRSVRASVPDADREMAWREDRLRGKTDSLKKDL